MPKDYKKDPDYVALDAPYAPLNEFILAEQAAGKLAQLAPWDNTRRLRDAVKAMRKHRLGATAIGQYYAAHPGAFPGADLGKDVYENHLSTVVATPSAWRIRKFLVTAAMRVWAQTPDRGKPTSYTTSECNIREDEFYPPLNDLVVALDADELIHSLWTAPTRDNPAEELLIGRDIYIGQTPLTLREALAILDRNIAGYRKITDHVIAHKAAIGIAMPDDDIRLVGSRLDSFINGRSKIMRLQDLAVLTPAYRSLAGADEKSLGIYRPKTARKSQIPLHRRAAEQATMQQNPLHDLMNQSKMADLDALLGRLTPRDQIIMECRIYDRMPLEDIGQGLDLTRERIRQIEKRALMQMVGQLEKKHYKTIEKTKPTPDDLWLRLFTGVGFSLRPMHGQAKAAVPHL